MRRLILLLVTASALAWTPPDGRLTLEWDYPEQERSTNLTFYVYSTTNVFAPMTNWAVLTNVVGTNLSVRLQIDPGQRFFVMTASNFWGESDFSEVASTPPLPRSNANLKLRRAE
jgi:hypothetical protein